MKQACNKLVGSISYLMHCLLHYYELFMKYQLQRISEILPLNSIQVGHTYINSLVNEICNKSCLTR